MPHSDTPPYQVCWDTVRDMQQKARTGRSKLLKAAARQDAEAAHQPAPTRQKGVLPNEYYPLRDLAAIPETYGFEPHA